MLLRAAEILGSSAILQNNGTLTCYADGSCDAYLRPFDTVWAWGYWISTAMIAQVRPEPSFRYLPSRADLHCGVSHAQAIVIGLRRAGFSPGSKAAAAGAATSTLLDDHPLPSFDYGPPRPAPSSTVLNLTGVTLAVGTCLATPAFLQYFLEQAPLIWGREPWWPKPNGCTTWPWCGDK